VRSARPFDKLRASALPLFAAASLVLMLLARVAYADRATARALMEDGDLRASAGDKEGALDRYRKAMDADPDLVDAYDKAIPLWLDTKRFDEAAKYLERATARHPELGHAWYALGYIYRQGQKWDAAIAAYEESVALQQGDPAPWWGLASSYEAAGRAGDAVRAYRTYRVLERDPAHARFRVDARAAITRLLGAPTDWRDAALRVALDGGGRATISAAAALAR
jgi:tetratricopeptide (TPR) repeat protein